MVWLSLKDEKMELYEAVKDLKLGDRAIREVWNENNNFGYFKFDNINHQYPNKKKEYVLCILITLEDSKANDWIIVKDNNMKRIKIVKHLTDTGFPTHDKHYATSHEEADKMEKKKFPKGYLRLKKEVRKLKKHELMGKNTKKGKVEVEVKFKKNKKEIGLHEKMENKKILELDKKDKDK